MTLERVSDHKFWNGTTWVADWGQAILTATLSTHSDPNSRTWTYNSGPPSFGLMTGDYHLHTQCYDQGNNQSGAGADFTVVGAVPTVSTSSPAPGSTVSSLQTLSGVVTDANGATDINRVEMTIGRTSDNKFWNGTIWVANPGDAILTATLSGHANPNSRTWTYNNGPPASGLIAGSYHLHTHCYDQAGLNSGVGASYTVVGATPTVSIVSPAPGSTVSSLQTLSGVVTDANGGADIHRVDMTLERTSDGKFWNGTTWVEGWGQAILTATLSSHSNPNSRTWTYSSGPPDYSLMAGNYHLHTEAYDQGQKHSGAGADFTVVGAVPTVSIVSPAPGNTVSSLQTLSGVVTDADGFANIHRVDMTLERTSDGKFWNGTEWKDFWWQAILTATLSSHSNPNSRTWTYSSGPPDSGLLAGNYHLHAEAYDQGQKHSGADADFSVVYGTGLRGSYYNNTDFTDFAFSRVDPQVNFVWGSGSPGPAVGNENFAVRWEGQIEPRYTELYTFFADADNAVRVWVNGQPVITRWTEDVGEATGQIALTQGVKSNIKIEFAEYLGAAQMKFLWASTSQAKEVVPTLRMYPAPAQTADGTGLRGQYFDDSVFSVQMFSRTDAQINFFWGDGAPNKVIGHDTFGVWWTGQIKVPSTGTYTFRTDSDNGSRLWINGQLVTNGWEGGSPIGTYDLLVGQSYDIKLQYKEDYGGAKAKLFWSSANQAEEIVPQAYLYPAANDSVPYADPPSKPNDARFVSQQVPTTMLAGRTYPVTVRFKNVGSNLWTAADNHKLASVSTHWGLTRVVMPSNVATGQEVSFNFIVTAPTTPGNYGFKWEMLQENVEWFGNNVSQEITVIPEPLLTVEQVTASQVRLKMPVLPQGASGFTLQRTGGTATTPGAVWTNVTTNLADQAIYTDSNLSSNTIYWYRCTPEGLTGAVPGAPVKVTTAPPPPPLPGAPGAPTFSAITATGVSVSAPVLPTNALSLTLQKKMQSEPDDAYVIMRSELAANSVTPITGLESGITYSFRFLAVGESGSTSGTAANVTTLASVVQQPGTPEFHDVTQTTLFALLPDLPVGATSLSLQKKLASQAESSYANVVTGRSGGDNVAVTGLTASTAYTFRVVAHGASGTNAGLGAGITTGTALPASPSIPLFSNLGPYSVTVSSPALPARATSLILQGKASWQSDALFVDIEDEIGYPGIATDVTGLNPGSSYVFRYVALNSGGRTPGVAASVTTQSVQVAWGAGSGIECSGIRQPTPNRIVNAGSALRLSSFLAVDWDARNVTVVGQTTSTTQYSDPCTYSWTASGGSFQGAVTKGQSVQWIAPTMPGTYTITLTVDDQNGANQSSANLGSRDDASKGFNDGLIKFSVSVTVL
jgi:hypothetical protein